MANRLKALPDWAEFAIVVAVAFGFFIASSVYTVLHPAGWQKPHHSNLTLVVLPVMEVVLGGALCLFLRARGWTLQRLGLTARFSDGGVGLALAFAAYVAYALAWYATVALLPDAARLAASIRVLQPGIPLAVTLIVPWINAIFEEVFVAGYVITALKDKKGLWFAVNVSVAIRLSYHLYQNVLGVIAAVPLGLIFGYWFARKGRLWPLIVAHAAIDLLGFLAYTKF